MHTGPEAPGVGQTVPAAAVVVQWAALATIFTEALMSQTAVVVGVGPGLGAALVRKFAAAGMQVIAAARHIDRLRGLPDEAGAEAVRLAACDATDPGAIARLFEELRRDEAELAIAVFNAGSFAPAQVVDIEPADFERCWRVGAFGGFLVGQAAARLMLSQGHGTIIFTGATASLRGGAGFANLASPKFALRALAQSMARELGPQGIHVAHVIIDGQIRSPRYAQRLAERGPDSLLDPDAIAEVYLDLHRQHRSAWTQELDLRPWVERF